MLSIPSSFLLVRKSTAESCLRALSSQQIPFLLDQPLTLGFGHTKYEYEVESDEEAGPETTQTRFLHK